MSKQFNEDGTYNKTDWKAGDKITATKLNKIEDAIEAVNNHDISRHQEAYSRLDALEAGVVANKQEIEAKVDALEDTVVSNKDAADLDIYRIDQHMTLLDKKIDDGVAEVEAGLEGLHAKDDELSEQLAHIENFNSNLLSLEYNDNDYNNIDSYNDLNKLFIELDKNIIYDPEFNSNRISTKNINIPKGIYTIKQENLWANLGNLRTREIIINGNGSVLCAEDFEGALFYNNDKFLVVDIYNVHFMSKNDGKIRTLLKSLGNGGAQNIRFHSCIFNGYWKHGFDLEGTDCNSEYAFNDCYINGHYESFLHIGENGSNMFLNYWFNNCKYWCTSTWIDAKLGGHFKLNNCDISAYHPTEETYLFKLGDGKGAYGTQTFIDKGSRYELKTAGAKVMNCSWALGQVIFDGCDFSPSAHIDVDRSNTFIFNNHRTDASGIYIFDKCALLGDITLNAGNKCDNTLYIKNCNIYNSDPTMTSIYDMFDFVEGSTKEKFKVKLINSSFLGELHNKTLDSFYTPKVNYTNNAIKTNDVWLNFLPTWIFKIEKPTIIKNIICISKPTTGYYWHKLGIRSNLGVLTEVSGKTCKCTNIDRFYIDCKVTINNDNSIIYTIKDVNKDTSTITLDTEITNGNIDNIISLALVEFDWNPHRGHKVITMDSPKLVYADLYPSYYGGGTFGSSGLPIDIIVETLE